ncbi:MAG TPA: pantoate--beta-alanine ligase [Thermoanaerobaculia bacterium]|nr:pantoate--beta-alanine ligase [Thermoanaerobaculia bacterium]
MHITRTIEETRSLFAAARRRGNTIGFVPTMGFLHTGHLSLVNVARDAGATFIVVSIFVNPKQFGPNEDFERYPRDEERDIAMLESAGVDVLFLPPVEVMYPAGASTMITVGGVSKPLEGERRPGHFDGVATVVAKLFNIVQPDVAAFGRKDAQQCAVIERMVRDLDLPVNLVFGETLREDGGLAMSSRNAYLSTDERAKAPVLYRALRACEEAITHGIHSVADLEKLMNRVVTEEGGVDVDYLTVVDPLTFAPPMDFEREVLVVGAVRVGKTRLIDNVRVPR